MSFNKQKMVKLILNECESIDNRCEGYKEKLLDAIAEILNAERQNKVQRIRIQQEVNDACHAAGNFLARKRDMDNPTTEASK